MYNWPALLFVLVVSDFNGRCRKFTNNRPAISKRKDSTRLTKTLELLVILFLSVNLSTFVYSIFAAANGGATTRRLA